MPITTTSQTSSLQVVKIAEKRAINKYLNRHLLFAPTLMDTNGVPTVLQDNDPRPMSFDLSSSFGQGTTRGTTIKVPDVQQRFFAKTKLEASPVEYQTLAVGSVSLTVTNHKYVAVRIEDYQKYYNNVDGYEDLTLESQIVALCQDVEESFFNLAPSFTTNTTIGTGSGYAVAEVDLFTANRRLFTANVPKGATAHAFLTPETYQSIMTSRKEYQLTGDQGVNIFNNATLKEKVAGFNVHRTNNVLITGSAAKQLAFIDNAFMFAFGFKPRTQETYNSAYLANESVVDMLFGVAIKRQQFAVLIDGDDTNNL